MKYLRTKLSILLLLTVVLIIGCKKPENPNNGGENTGGNGGSSVEKAYIIGVLINPTIGGNVTGGGSYQEGQSCTLQAVANYGYSFSKWTENDEQVSNNESYTFTVTRDRVLVAHFTKCLHDYSINVSSSPEHGGNVSGGGTFIQGQICTVSATEAVGYSFYNWTENDTVVTGEANYSFPVNSTRNLVAHFMEKPQAPTGAIDGVFSVSANRRVFFSQGNLQYCASTRTWQFAQNQYDRVGSANKNISPTYNGWIDLFGWGTSGYYCGNTCYRPWDTNSDGSLYGPSGTYNLTGSYAQSDWGVHNAISNGGDISGQWRTLTREEWNYVFYERSTSADIRFAMAQVNNVKGIILLPDNWKTSYHTINNYNQNFTDFSSNVIDINSWRDYFEAHGAVFLPVAGYRIVTSIYSTLTWGGYWSTTSSTNNNSYAWYFLFDNGGLLPDLNGDGYQRNLGLSVRLVCPAE